MGYLDDSGDEPANSLGHIDLTRDQQLREELAEFTFTDPTEGWNPRDNVMPPGDLAGAGNLGPPIEQVYGIDGSRVEVTIGDRRLNKRVGFLSIRLVEIDMTVLREQSRQAFLDPSRVEDLGDVTEVNMVLPSSNTLFDAGTTHESWRKMVFENFKQRPVFGTRLFTCYHELLKREGRIQQSRGQLLLENCPNPDCEEESLIVSSVREDRCPKCREPTYPTDALRTHERVAGSQENVTALNVLMGVVEHIVLFALVTSLANDHDKLDRTAIVKDGPLAQFDTAAWIHDPILEVIEEIQQRHRDQGRSPFVVTGVHKTGKFASFAEEVKDRKAGPWLLELPNDIVYKYISAGDRTEPFGKKTYYGKNFIYRTASRSNSAHCFAFTVPRNYGIRDSKEELRAGQESYPELARTVTILDMLRTIRYENGLIPLVVAHDQASLPEDLSNQILGELTRLITKT